MKKFAPIFAILAIGYFFTDTASAIWFTRKVGRFPNTCETNMVRDCKAACGEEFVKADFCLDQYGDKTSCTPLLARTQVCKQVGKVEEQKTQKKKKNKKVSEVIEQDSDSELKDAA